jgi:hypothetical protein
MIFLLARKSHQNIFHARGNNHCNNSRQPQHNQNQRVSKPLEENNVVDQETLPWFNPCGLPHDQYTCLIAKEAFQQGIEANIDHII